MALSWWARKTTKRCIYCHKPLREYNRSERCSSCTRGLGTRKQLASRNGVELDMSKLAYCPNCHILAVVHRKKCRKCKERIPEEYLRKLKNGNSKENCCGKGLNNSDD